MKRLIVPLAMLLVLGAGCRSSSPTAGLYTIGILQINETPTGRDVLRGFTKALEDGGLRPDRNVRLLIESGRGEISRVQRIASDMILRDVDMIVALSTSSLQAALHASRDIPIVFSAVANPYLAGAGLSAQDHLENVAGVSSLGPIKQSLALIKQVLPDVQRIGTLWTPSELNSNFYLEIAREGASQLGLEIVAVPVTSVSDVLLSAQVLVNKRIDVIFPISDNTINSAFEALGLVAEESGIPLFGSFLHAAQLGASAALGWDFYEMGYRAGRIALRVKEGENPRDIPFESMNQVQMHLNLKTAGVQGIRFPDEVLRRADKVYGRAEED